MFIRQKIFKNNLKCRKNVVQSFLNKMLRKKLCIFCVCVCVREWVRLCLCHYFWVVSDSRWQCHFTRVHRPPWRLLVYFVPYEWMQVHFLRFTPSYPWTRTFLAAYSYLAINFSLDWHMQKVALWMIRCFKYAVFSLFNCAHYLLLRDHRPLSFSFVSFCIQQTFNILFKGTLQTNEWSLSVFVF